MQTEKPSCEDPAIELGAEFALDKASDRCALLARLSEKALEVLSYDLGEQDLFRLVALVQDGLGSRRDRGGSGRLLDRGYLGSSLFVGALGDALWCHSGVGSLPCVNLRLRSHPVHARGSDNEATTRTAPVQPIP
jgi:hypothetical protein